MLYVSTREKFDAYTTARTLASDTCSAGGRYLPYRMPHFNDEDIRALSKSSFGQNVAAFLNLFFGKGLTAWDVEFSIGRNPVRIAAPGQRMLMAECWRNLDGSYAMLERRLAARLCDAAVGNVKVTSWVRIGIRIAVLAGIFGQLQAQGITEKVDMAVADGDFTTVMALWYARMMGMPVADLIVSCSNGSDAWNLLHNGQLRPGCQPELERLVYSALGADANLACQAMLANGQTCNLEQNARNTVRSGIFASVVSSERIAAVIPNVFRTTSYILEPAAAAAYSALMDYRGRSGQTRTALLLCDSNPVDCAETVATALGMTPQQLKEKLN